MFARIRLITLFALVAAGASACSSLPSSATIPIPFTGQQVTLSPGIAQGTQPDQSPEPAQPAQPASPATGTVPQAGANSKGVEPGKGKAALLQLLERAGWDGGVVTKISNNQITLRTAERPNALNNQNQPNPAQPNQDQNGQNRKALGRTDTVNVSANTIIIVPGKISATLSDLHTGDRLVVDVPNGQNTAALVMSAPKEFGKDNVSLGMVTDNTNGALTLRSPGGNDDIETNGSTQVFKLARDGVSPGAVNDLRKGNLVFALGSGDGTDLTAQVIFELPQGALSLGKGIRNGKKNSQPQSPTTPNQGG
jgi:hypothetical protein